MPNIAARVLNGRQVTLSSKASQLRPVLDLEHLEYLADMSLDCNFAETQDVGDFSISVPQGDKLDNSHVLIAQALYAVSLGQCLTLVNQNFQVLLVDPDVTIVNHLDGFAEAGQIGILRNNSADVITQKETGKISVFKACVDKDKSGSGVGFNEGADVFPGVEENNICVKGPRVFMFVVEGRTNTRIGGQFFYAFAKEAVT